VLRWELLLLMQCVTDCYLNVSSHQNVTVLQILMLISKRSDEKKLSSMFTSVTVEPMPRRSQMSLPIVRAQPYEMRGELKDTVWGAKMRGVKILNAGHR